MADERPEPDIVNDIVDTLTDVWDDLVPEDAGPAVKTVMAILFVVALFILFIVIIVPDPSDVAIAGGIGAGILGGSAG